MAILAGIDEAGYGPLLGPLVSAATAFSVPNALCNKPLWNILASSIARQPSRSSGRLAVADSKKLFAHRDGLARLERTALTFMHLLAKPTAHLGQLLRSLGDNCQGQMNNYPWYDGQSVSLPHAADAKDLATCLNALRLDTQRNDIAFLAARSQVLLVGRYNDLAEKTRNKSAVLFGLVGKYIARLVKAYAGEGLVIYADKLGGRTRYRSLLQQLFSDWDLRILQETRQASGYQLTKNSLTWQVHFQAKAESSHLPVALASIYAKYVRELFMELLNRYWCREVAGLRPTAGYYSDGRRFLADIALPCKKLNTPMRRLLRVR